MVEEEFKKDDDDDEDPVGINGRRDSTLDNASADEADLLKAREHFTREERVQSFQDLAYVNRFARNCPATSSMSLLTVQKFKFAGPDPPAEPA